MQDEGRLTLCKFARDETAERQGRTGSNSAGPNVEFGEYECRTSSRNGSIANLRLCRLRSRKSNELQAHRTQQPVAGRKSSVRSNAVKDATSELKRLRIKSQRSQEIISEEVRASEISTTREQGQSSSTSNETCRGLPGTRFSERAHRRPLGSTEIVPTAVLEVDATSTTGPNPCKVTCAQNGRSWVARGRIAKAVPGGNGGLHVWQLGDAMSQRQGFVFGFADPQWHYLSVSRPERPLRYESSGSDPSRIQVDSDDPRIFRPKADSRRGTSGVILLSANFQGMGVHTDDDGRLVLAQDGPDLSSWIIN